jgi:hypothetical protein
MFPVLLSTLQFCNVDYNRGHYLFDKNNPVCLFAYYSFRERSCQMEMYTTREWKGEVNLRMHITVLPAINTHFQIRSLR